MIIPAKELGYNVEGNIEAGRGRADLILHHKSDQNLHGIILEFKTITTPSAVEKIKTDDDLQQLATTALHQIGNLDYLARFQGKCRKAFLFGVAVLKKFVYVAGNEVTL